MSIVRRLRAVVPIGAAYFVAALTSLWFTRFGADVVFLWSATAVMATNLIAHPRGSWRDRTSACFVGGLAAAALSGFGLLGMALFTIGAMLEGLLASHLLGRRRETSHSPLGSLPWLGRYVIPVGLVAPAIIALVLLPLVWRFDRLFLPILLRVVVGHALGNILFVPLVHLVLRRGPVALWRETKAKGVEAAMLLGLVAVVAGLIFSQGELPLLFLSMLPVILVSFRLGYGPSSLAVGIVAIIGTVLTLGGHGPIQLIQGSNGALLQFFQFFLAAMLMTALPIAADLESRGELNRRIRTSEERYRLLAEHSSDILLHLEVDGTVRYVSPSIRQLSGHDPDELIGSNGLRLVAPEHVRRVREEHLATFAAKGETHSFDYLAMTRDGERRWFESHARAVMSEGGKVNGLLCVVRDISARKENEQWLSDAAMTDTLTALPNRRSFEMAVGKRLATRAAGEPDCIALFDVDRFKRVNDTHGHDAGDAVLQTVARVMRGVMRREDAIARLGGEEFVVLFPNTPIPQALMICERMRSEMAAAETPAGGQQLRVTVSGGVAVLGPEGLDHALKHADAALYCAKRGGRDQMALAA